MTSLRVLGFTLLFLPSLAACSGTDGPADGSGGDGAAPGGLPGSGGALGTGGSVDGDGGTTAGGGAAAGGTGGDQSGGAGGTGGSGTGGGPAGAITTTNLFTELDGRTQEEVDQKVQTAVDRFFGIGTGEPTTPTEASGYRCYYELPQDSSMAFIWAPDSNDIRSEGMSYGMMIAVQMDMQTEFDRLWKFAQTYMQYPENTPTTAWRHYFRWQGTVNRSNPSNWTVTFGATTVPAPDGDEYFAAALYVAHRRWGSAGAVNYLAEADKIADAMLNNTATNDGRYPLIHTTENQVVFVPYGDSYAFTDPSYHLPAFYELFALDGPDADAARWQTIADISREYFVDSAHDTTGLHPDYATFAGAPTTGSAGDMHDQFRYDAWRVVMNMAVDYAWFSQSETSRTQVEKYHAFFDTYLGDSNVSNSLFHVDGSNASGGGSTALTATLAAGALASDAENRGDYVTALWNVPQQTGTYRYYQESVYLLGLLATAGKFSATF